MSGQDKPPTPQERLDWVSQNRMFTPLAVNYMWRNMLDRPVNTNNYRPMDKNMMYYLKEYAMPWEGPLMNQPESVGALRIGGISAQTKARLKSDAGWTEEDFAPDKPKEHPKPQPLGNDPTRKVTPEEYDRMLKEQKRIQEEKYLRYKQRKRM